VYFSLVIIIACAVFYYRVGESDYDSGLLFAALSVGLWLGGSYFLGLGLMGSLLVQAGLFIGLTFWNMARNKPKS
jgi:hypothetical protein